MSILVMENDQILPFVVDKLVKMTVLATFVT